MASPIPKYTSIVGRTPFKFFDPANTTNAYFPQVNPQQAMRKVGNARKFMRTTNGTNIIIGDREYPPDEISLAWPQADITDYEGLRALSPISPLVMVDNNDDGFLGVLNIDGAQQLPGKSGNVWEIKAAFLVLSPYNGQSTTLMSLTAPTLSVGMATSGGYIPTASTFYVWSTASNKNGETTVSAAATVTSTSNNSLATITFTHPTSTYYIKTSLYWNTVNNPATATFLTDIPNGFTPSFPIYVTPQSISYQTPPLYGTAFTGRWSGGRWTQLP